MTNLIRFRMKKVGTIVACFAVKRVAIIAIALFWGSTAAAQDVITLRNGNVLEVNITEETERLVKYTLFNDERARPLAVAKRDVVKIVYKNGNEVEFDALTTSTIANKGDFAIGINGLANMYGSLPCVGFGPRIQYNVSDDARVVVEFDFSSQSILGITLGISDFSAYVHGLRPYMNKNGKERLGYVSLGLGMLSIKIKEISGETNDSDYNAKNTFIFGIGYGTEYPIAPNLSFNWELRFKLSGGLTGGRLGTSINIPVGLTYKF